MCKWLTFHRDLGLQPLAFYLLLIIPFLVTLLAFDRLIGERIRKDVEANDISSARAIALETDIAIDNSLKTVDELSSYANVIDVDEEGFEILILDASGQVIAHPDPAY